MYVSNNLKIAFIAVPKTGTRTIYQILREQYSGKLVIEHAQIVPKQYSSYFTFIIKRNPYDRVCSVYWAVCKRHGDKYNYKEYFQKVGYENILLNFLLGVKNNKFNKMKVAHFEPQYRFHNNKINKILRFEHLEEDFNSLPFVKTRIALPKINHTTVKVEPTEKKPNPHPVRPHWEEMVGPDEGKLINELYKKDFELLGYEMRKY